MVSKNMISQSCSFKHSNAATVLAVLLVFVWHNGSHTRPLSVPCRSHTDHIQITYRSHTRPIRAHTGHIRSHTGHIRSHTGPIWVTYAIRVPYGSHTGPIQVTYRSHTSVVSVALVSCSEELYHTAPNLLTGIVKICSAGLWLRVSVRYRVHFQFLVWIMSFFCEYILDDFVNQL